jgi:hypothetical protein
VRIIDGHIIRFWRHTNPTGRVVGWTWSFDSLALQFHSYQLCWAKTAATDRWMKEAMLHVYQHVARNAEFQSLYDSITEWRERASEPVLLFRDWMYDNGYQEMLWGKVILPGLKAKVVWPPQWKEMIRSESWSRK